MPRCTTRWVPFSSAKTRFLPRRCALRIEWPSIMARKSLAVLWRRTSRPLVTEADFTFLPIRSRASDARTVSTSGSSGIAPPPGIVGGARFGALLRRRHAGTHDPIRKPHGRRERRVVRGTRRRDVILRRAEAVRLRPLTKSRLGIAFAGTRRCIGDGVGQHVVDEGFGGVVAIL